MSCEQACQDLHGPVGEGAGVRPQFCCNLQLKAFSACSLPSTAIINLSELIFGGLMNALIPESEKIKIKLIIFVNSYILAVK